MSIIRCFLGNTLNIIMYNILFIYFGQGSISIDDRHDNIDKINKHNYYNNNISKAIRRI